MALGVIATQTRSTSLVARLLRALALDRQLFREIMADRQSMTQALGAVLLVAIATGLSTLRDTGFNGFASWVALTLVGWVVWTTITYLIGTKVLETAETRAEWSEVARVLAFAQAPGLIRVFGLISGLGPMLAVVTIIWQFIAMAIALRLAMNFSSYWRAAGVIAIGFIPYLAIVGALDLLLR